MAQLETMTSKDASGNGILVMSPVSRVMRLSTPSAWALARVTSGELPDWSTVLGAYVPEPFRAFGGSVNRENQIEAGHAGPQRSELREARCIGDERARPGILQAIRDRLDPEQHCQRQGDGAELVDGDVARSD